MDGMDGMGGMSMPVGDVTPEIVLVIGAVVVLVVALFAPRSAQRWCAGLALCRGPPGRTSLRSG